MAETSTSRKAFLLRKLFEILAIAPDGMAPKEAIHRLAQSVTLTPHEEGFYNSGAQRFERIVRFATISTVKAGWLVKNKGLWFLSEEGLAAVRQFPNPDEFRREARRLYLHWRKGQQSSANGELIDEEDDVGPQAAGVTFDEAEEQAWADIERYLQTMLPYEFQDLVADLLTAMGYFVSWVAPPGKDGGYDIAAWTDPLGTRPPRIKVQVRRVISPVSVDGLRAFLAVLDNDDVGLFVSAGGFTRDAEQTARSQANRRITLIDLKQLVKLWITHYPKLTDIARQRFTLRPIYFLSPEN